jgi:hypothetical protein
MLRLRIIVYALISMMVSLVYCPFAYPDEGDGGQAGAFLRRSIGARATGMGGAFTAIANDATATYWNPSGLGQLRNAQIAAMYTILSLDRNQNFVSYAQPIGALGALGLSWIHFGVSKMDGRDTSGNPTGDFSDSEMAFGMSYGKTFAEVLSIGGTAKYLSHALADNKASGFGFDAGVLIKFIGIPFSDVSVGVMVQDIASSVEWDTDSKREDEFPMNVRFGIVISPKVIPLNLAAEIEKNGEQEIKYHAGGEYFLSKVLGIRIGYNDGSLTTGGSLRVPVGTFSIQVDYAFSPDALEGAAHQVSLITEF